MFNLYLIYIRSAIYTLISMENKGDALPMAAQPTPAGGKTKPLKKEEQYRIMFGELERFLKKHTWTDKHIKVSGRD